MLNKISLSLLFIIAGIAQIKAITPEDAIKGAVLGSALGDALGRVTEFIDTTDGIKKKYGSNGLHSFKDFKTNDWVLDPQTKQKIAAYTDDTLMSIIVLEEAINNRVKLSSITKEDTEKFEGVFTSYEGEYYTPIKTIHEDIAFRFIDLLGKNRYTTDPLYDTRAHGPTNIRSIAEIEHFNENFLVNTERNRLHWLNRNRFSINVLSEGGCGSVMRSWPLGIMFFDHQEELKKLVDCHSRLTHRHPMARAASVAVAIGIARIIESTVNKMKLSPQEVVESMISAAEAYDDEEAQYKPRASKISDDSLSAKDIAQDKVLTSDMIRYAARKALSGKGPHEILGVHNQKQANHRSPQGFLLAWAADEAVAAAVYIFLRHPYNLEAALHEAVNTPGDSDTIATIAGALVGAYAGFEAFEKTGFDYQPLENVLYLQELSKKSVEVLTNYKLSGDVIPTELPNLHIPHCCE
jgi:ADP-ribosylglycohydrolase